MPSQHSNITSLITPFLINLLYSVFLGISFNTRNDTSDIVAILLIRQEHAKVVSSSFFRAQMFGSNKFNLVNIPHHPNYQSLSQSVA
jgi:hypothetical protein